MHSKIFQIESFPVEENYRITEDNYIGDHWFVYSNLEPKMSALNTAYDDRYGFYVDCDDTGLVTLNQFLRQAKPEIRYYFGGTVDYHC